MGQTLKNSKMIRIKKQAFGLFLIVGLVFSTSCKENSSKDPNVRTAPAEEQVTSKENKMDEKITEETKTQGTVNAYLALKDALVNDNKEEADAASEKLQETLKDFDTSTYDKEEQESLKAIINDAIDHTKSITDKEIKDQRSNFKKLNDDVTKLVAITGSSITLYEQYCPMYDKGSSWLSAKKEIRNPYYGSQMLKCGEVKREIN